MNKVTKGLLVAGAEAAAVTGMIFFARQAGAGPPEPPPDGTQLGATISIQIIDPRTGEPVPRNSPALVIEGTSYLARITVTNASTRLGAPTDADLQILMAGLAGNTGISFPLPWVWNAPPGGVQPWDITFDVPDNTGPGAGEIRVQVVDPGGVELDLAIEPLTIEEAAIVYAADVILQVA